MSLGETIAAQLELIEKSMEGSSSIHPSRFEDPVVKTFICQQLQILQSYIVEALKLLNTVEPVKEPRVMTPLAKGKQVYVRKYLYKGLGLIVEVSQLPGSIYRHNDGSATRWYQYSVQWQNNNPIWVSGEDVIPLAELATDPHLTEEDYAAAAAARPWGED